MKEHVFYWDSSALIKRYIEEDGSNFVRSLSEGRPNFTAALSHAEILATFYRLRRDGRASQFELEKLLGFFFDDWKNLLIVSYGAQVQRTAEKSIERSPLKGADLVHLASALKLVEEGLEVVLLTFDSRLEKAAQDHGLATQINR
jgi:uncharacterized protein